MLAVFGSSPALADQPRIRHELNGRWRFTLDPLAQGESSGWYKPDLPVGRWDHVEVPHCWPVEARYQHTGPAWYRRTFTPPLAAGRGHIRLRFGAVFYRSKVWLNGRLLGEHEGGYTPFAFDVSSVLRPGEENIVVVMADNSWSTETLPGARPGGQPQQQVYPWWAYGGIVRDVYLEYTPAVFIEKQKIVAEPDLETGTAQVTVKLWLKNATSETAAASLRLRISPKDGREPVAESRTDTNIPPNETRTIQLDLPLATEDVELWDYDHPNLYASSAALDSHAGPDVLVAHFGIRKVEARDGRLLLNGEPVQFGGANRASDHPHYGLIEPLEVIETDMSLMKQAGMGLARILHHPAPEALLDWADRHGFLIIAEAGNWQLAPQQMDSPLIREKYRSQAREMVERDWNHPSVIAWSTGNEYDANSPAGIRWTRAMAEFTRRLDDSRLVTFVSLGGNAFDFDDPKRTSFDVVDFLCLNSYYRGERTADALRRLHSYWPGKPILVTEFGMRADYVLSEADRIDYLREVIGALRPLDYLIGMSVWSWNDYRSLFPGTNRDGYRRWGLVTPDRKTRPAYRALRHEFSPVLIDDVRIDRRPVGLQAAFQVHVKLRARAEFPARTIRDHLARLSVLDHDDQIIERAEQVIPSLSPGAGTNLRFHIDAFRLTRGKALRVEIVQPTGFVGIESTRAVAAQEAITP